MQESNPICIKRGSLAPLAKRNGTFALRRSGNPVYHPGEPVWRVIGLVKAESAVLC